MAIFEADKGFHFSEDGTKPWAHFRSIKGENGVPVTETDKDGLPRPVFRLETDNSAVIERLSGVEGVRRVDTPAPSAGRGA
jgi:hypothetical protein